MKSVAKIHKSLTLSEFTSLHFLRLCMFMPEIDSISCPMSVLLTAVHGAVGYSFMF